MSNIHAATIPEVVVITGAALVSMVLMSLGLMGIVYRVEKRFVFLRPDSGS